MKAKIENKIEELALMILGTDRVDASVVLEILAELKIFESILSEVALSDERVARVKGIVPKTIEHVAQLLNAGGDAGFLLRTLSTCITNFQEVFLRGKAPENLRFPFAIDSEKKAELEASLRKDFTEKFKSDTEELQPLILKMENSAEFKAPVAEIKRLLHTLKGEAGMMNVLDVQMLLHEAETYLDNHPDENCADKLFQLFDWLMQKITVTTSTAGEDCETAVSVMQRLFVNTPSSPHQTEPTPTPVVEKTMQKTTPTTDYSYVPDTTQAVSLDDQEFIREFITEATEHLDNVEQGVLKLEENVNDQEAISTVFRAYHTIKGIAGMLDFEDIKHLAHAAESILDMARQSKITLAGHVTDLILAATDKLRHYIEAVSKALDNGAAFYRDQNAQPLLQEIKDFLAGVENPGAPVAEVKTLEPKSPEPVSIQPAPVAENLAAVQTTPVAQPQEPSEEGQRLTPVGAKLAFKPKELIKVDTEILDKILDYIGELVIAQSMVTRNFSDGLIGTDLAERNLRHMEKITRELQELGMSLRMTSLKNTFEKMARLVRDVAKKTGKLVSFVMEGEDTELDRNVVERISDPLVHMIRNAVDHGIESNIDDRVNAGKKPSGTVRLRAYHEGGYVHIELKDDGKGLDKEAILRKGIERGLVQPGREISDEEIFNLIFMPGFSTAQKVTDVSGRGVGMDVVKKNIESLRGRMVIRSTKGQGSTFNIILPLTLAIIDGMIITVGREKFIVPTLNIRESIKMNKLQFNHAMGSGESALIRNELIPIYRLHDMFGVSRALFEGRDEELLVVVESEGRRVGFLVDEILGQQQIVIKNLGTLFEKVRGFSGGAIMPDGSVGLILDIASLITNKEAAVCEEVQEHASASTA